MNAILLLVVAATSAAASKLSPAASFADAPVPPSEREFLINGWRWHHRSVLRELRRFIRCLERVDACEPESLRRALDAREFVWGFSWSALHGIEVDLYLPWLRQQLPAATFGSELDELQRELAEVWSLGERIGRELPPPPAAGAAAAAAPAARPPAAAAPALALAARLGLRPPGGGGAPTAEVVQALELSRRLEQLAGRVYARTERTLVPGVAAYVPRPEQERFNDKVLKYLGVWPSRVHLCGMAEAINGDDAELLQFKRQIPKVARMMLPRWRRKLYLPRTECLR